MEQLNAGDSLWKPYEPTTSVASDENGVAGKEHNLADGPDTPICCWLICTGIRTEQRANRARRKPADA